jgi:membrane fusion protein, multidrug efflux system
MDSEPANEKTSDKNSSAEAEKSGALQTDQTKKPERRGPPSKPFYERPLLMAGLIVATVVIVIGGIGWWLYARQFESTDDAFIDGNTVQMAPKISGYVEQLIVQDNQFVRKGDLLLQIDARDYEVALADAQAGEASAEGAVAQAKAHVDASVAEAAADEAQVLAAKATAKNAQQDLERNASLTPRSVSQQSLDSSSATASSTRAQELAARAKADSAIEQVKLAKSQLVSSEADLRQAQVRVDQAKLNLSYTKIVAPIDGRVTHRTVQMGDYVDKGAPLFALVDPNLWVIANFKETQLSHMRAGQAVDVTVDAFPGTKLAAHVDSFQRGTGARFSALPAENATGNYVKVVQRVPVKIVFDGSLPVGMVLGPGMSVVPTVSIQATPEAVETPEAGPTQTDQGTTVAKRP